jgi:YidC/Oxa1 family membrane protein insertase
MDFLNNLMLQLLQWLQGVTGTYTLAIVAVTVLLRAVLWPLNSSQARSMKQMQALQPKLKALQEQYKETPAELQKAMMALYAEHKFNPFAGCLPLLVQLPIFIALYGVLSSPDFLQLAGHEALPPVGRLQDTLHSFGGESLDGRFAVQPTDSQFLAGQTLTVTHKEGKPALVLKLSECRISDPAKLLIVKPKPLLPGEPLRLLLNLSDLNYDAESMAQVANVALSVTNPKTKEIEKVTLLPQAGHSGVVEASVPTTQATSATNWGILAMIAVYGLLSWVYQKTMSLGTAASEPQGPNAALMQWMPLLFAGLLVIIPIPAGVMLYLIVTLVMMLLQNLVMAYQDKQGKPPAPPSQAIIEQ